MMGAFKPNVYRWEVLFFSCSQQEQNKQLHLTIFVLYSGLGNITFYVSVYCVGCLTWNLLSEEQDVLQSMSNSIFK